MLVYILGENPQKVRILVDEGKMSTMIEKIESEIIEQKGSLISILNFLIAINTNDKASELAKKSLLRKIFQKCFLSEHQEDVGKKIIMLYSCSM